MNERNAKPYWLHWPADLFEEMQERLERVYEGGRQALGGAPRQPATDVRETTDRFVIDVELPGVDPADCNVSVLGRTLMIDATRRPCPAADGERPLRSERYVGAFSREVTLPAEVEPAATRATYHAGVLHIELTKLSAERPHKVPVECEG